MLGEFGTVAFANDIEAAGIPNIVFKTDDLSPQVLGLFGVGGSDDLAADIVCAEQPRLFCHHIVFGSRIADAVDFKGRRIPLAEDGFIYLIFMFWCVSPEV